MSTYESKIKSIPHPQELVYTTLANLNNLALLKDKIPQDKIKDLSFDTDNVSVNVAMIGKVKLSIIRREPFKTIKLSVEGAPSEAFIWIQLKEVASNDVRIKITLKAELNAMIKMVLKGKIEQFINGFADTLAALDYAKV